MWCFGEDLDGQLGDGPDGELSTEPKLALVGLEDRARGVTAGSLHTCAWLEDDSVWCWGRNVDGRVGTGSTSEVEVSPVKVEF